MGALDKLETLGVTGILVAAGYLIYVNWEKVTAAICRLPGAHEVFGEDMCPEGFGQGDKCQSGYFENKDGTCCPNGSVYENGMCKPTNVPVCPQGTIWSDGQCVPYVSPDKDPGTCILPEKWDPIIHQCINPVQLGMIQCHDGSWHYEQNCPEKQIDLIENQRQILRRMMENNEPALCDKTYPGIDTWMVVNMPYEYAEKLRICAIGTRPVSDLHTCASGAQVDLNNPPGITLEEACRRNTPIEQRGWCVMDWLGSRAGAGSGCGEAYCDVKVKYDGWVHVPGTYCCNSPITHEAWMACGGYT